MTSFLVSSSVAVWLGCSTASAADECNRPTAKNAPPRKSTDPSAPASSTRAAGERSRSAGLDGESATQGGEEFLDPGRFLIRRDFLGLDGVEEIGRQPRAVGGFLRRQLGAPTYGIQLLTQRRAGPVGGDGHQVVVACSNSAERDDDRRRCPTARRCFGECRQI